MPASEPRKRLGARIRALREERGLTQEQLAVRSGLHRTYVSALENGARNTSVDNLWRVAEAFGLPLSELLDGL